MNKISFYVRYPLKNISVASYHLTHIPLKSHVKGAKDDDKPAASPKKKETNKEALNKLNLLLKQIVDGDTVNITSKLELAKPVPKRISKRHDKSEAEETEKHVVEQDVVSSVKNVAKSLGGDTKQTESELLSKLLNLEDTTLDDRASSMNLSEVIRGMKIDRSTKSVENITRAAQVRDILQKSKYKKGTEEPSSFIKRRPRNVQQIAGREKERVNFFSGNGLGIFTDVAQYIGGEPNKTWQKLYERDLKLAVTHPPANYFQQMILWTEQGKIWKFPIDNEQGMEEEQNVYFAEHIFLEKHLE
ncbi:hypothetical protein AMK59_5825, partial [Oryctes borbonicus]